MQGVTRSYRGEREVRALDDVTLAVERGELVVVRGPSGCGKSTLLLTLGGMLRPTSGEIRVLDRSLIELSPHGVARFRRHHLGFVFQLFHLIPYLSVLENVTLGLRGVAANESRRRGGELLERLGLTARASHRPSQLSVGERQRVAVARAIVHEPDLVLADEPTGNLDPENEAEVCRALSDYHQRGGTVVCVTHGVAATRIATRTVEMRDGRILESSPSAR